MDVFEDTKVFGIEFKPGLGAWAIRFDIDGARIYHDFGLIRGFQRVRVKTGPEPEVN